MKITKVKEMIYIIQSEEKGGVQNYTIDLNENSRMGSCTCSHFKFRVQPAWRRSKQCDPCKHILLSIGEMIWAKMHSKTY